MDLQTIIALIALSGAIGGIVNCTLSGEFVLPHVDTSTKVWRPGWVGNVIVGSIAALAVWGIYGPFASYDLAHPAPQDFRLTVAQLLSSVVIGLSGGKTLSLMADKNAERFAKNQLATALDAIVKTTPQAQ